jgi:hypothetical protein
MHFPPIPAASPMASEPILTSSYQPLPIPSPTLTFRHRRIMHFLTPPDFLLLPPAFQLRHRMVRSIFSRMTIPSPMAILNQTDTVNKVSLSPSLTIFYLTIFQGSFSQPNHLSHTYEYNTPVPHRDREVNIWKLACQERVEFLWVMFRLSTFIELTITMQASSIRRRHDQSPRRIAGSRPPPISLQPILPHPRLEHAVPTIYAGLVR